MSNIWRDVRYGVRMLWKSPGFTAIAILSLALGIGANTAIFSLVNTVLLRPLPVARPEQLVEVYGTLHNGADYTLQSYPNYKEYRDRAGDAFEGMIAYRFAPISMSHAGASERVWGYLVSGNYFDVLGVRPLMGRGFTPEEDRTPGAFPVAVMSYGCWQRRFGADPNIVGKSVSLNGRSFTIVGVASKDFNGTEIAYAPELFVPMMMAHEIEPDSDWLESRNSDNIFVVGRLKDGVTTQQAESVLTALTLELAREYPQENEGRGVRLMTPGLFIPDIRNSVIGFATVLMGVVGLVLLLACVNLANLLLARATERRKEIAIRLAIGARRIIIVRQLLVESVLLSLAGGVCGLLLAAWINDFVASAKLPTDIALVIDLKIDWRVLSFTFLVSVLTGVVFSLLPALQSSSPDLVPALKDEASMGGFRRSRLRNVLVVAQVSLSLVLLVCAGLIVRSLQAAQSMRPGFNPLNAVALSFDVGLQGYNEERGRLFQKQVLERARALPGVMSAALVTTLPLSLDYSYTTIYIEGQAPVSSSQLPVAIPNTVSPGYFQTMEIALRGRDFTEQDDKEETRFIIVNETFARKFFPNQEAIGRRFNFDGPEEPFWEIVGVAADGKYNTLGEEPKPAFYRPLLRNYNTSTSLVARNLGDSQTAIAALRREVQSLDPTLPLYGVKTLTEHMQMPLFPARMAAVVLGSFGLMALVLAAIGIYGVMSYTVAGRIREIGVRMALGARPRDVLRLIVGQGMTLALIGLGLGIVFAFLAAQMLTSLLYGISSSDPLTYTIVALLLAGVALLACYIPARRATRVDPMIALRYE
ncbi:MAG TPA: ABC transporter permease [Pyrinomonadaceae bacterium]|jgi:putative ABC transport system permease protein